MLQLMNVITYMKLIRKRLQKLIGMADILCIPMKVNKDFMAFVGLVLLLRVFESVHNLAISFRHVSDKQTGHVNHL